ncbi:putative phosphoribosylaminoimidazole-succinocarboxamide synthase [Coniochaeta ligniaria NRRL 30616]|uniref:Phosphoribosylaminoimidazole-succinocarboxamide synthase n=1 Tax=Coniochaeta ligniaria NRRL 30616 TaxID=1408157 RepID=A0A1J7IV67_9PEZI|nr:putative phosphoribosylaminoimidazole-succinocarboxamide synthase [Coniochaeta ligniaria NRRL 30616]
MTSLTVTDIELTSLPKLAHGKVRDLFTVDDATLLFVTTDRISAYDIIMANGVPFKGAILTYLTAHWFSVLSKAIPDLKTHFLGLTPPPSVRLTAGEQAVVRHRTMLVRKLKIFPVEAIVRGYLTGSGYKEYVAKGTVHGIKLPAGLKNCDKIPGGAIYTPSTKAELGAHDENISPEQAAKIVGEKYAKRIEELALKCYNAAAEYARERGIIIADTKFEFGLDESTDEVVLVDEVLTPDSSRFWPADKYEAGREQESFDKQFLRDWLTRSGLKGKEGVEMPDDVVQATAERYREAFKLLTGKGLDEVLGEN